MLKLILHCLFSPRLYKKYGEGASDALYQPHSLEKWGDMVIKTVHTLTNISFYSSPFICMYFYTKGLYTFEKAQAMAPFVSGIAWIMALSYIIRTFGRVCNPEYKEFLKVLNDNTTDHKAYLESIRKYDFEFSSWPVSYSLPPKKRLTWALSNPFTKCANSDLPVYYQVTIQLLAYVVVHTFGLRLIYPGTLSIIYNSLWSQLLLGRTHLVENYSGKRTKLRTADDNTIDTMFVDNRSLFQEKGKILVICCEGNSGFYEIGIMHTPIKCGFSALGWNHPGFAGSTGTPFPNQEQSAIDAVIQFAINELGFEVKDIVLFGWSIGGYAATWAAVQYPDVKALVLDATFDDLLPIAQSKMPSSWSLLVKEVVRSYADLNIAELINDFSGPVHLIRRTRDEVLCLRQSQISTNRANNLLIKLVESRHNLSNEEKKLLRKYVNLLSTQRNVLRSSETGESDLKILEVIAKYMKDFSSTHCTPLPEDHFLRIIEE